MKNSAVAAFLEKAKNKKIMRRCVAFMSAFVILFVFYASRLNADTLERIPTCGYPDHEHTEACYDADGALICAQHVHTDACYQQRPLRDEAVETIEVETIEQAAPVDAGVTELGETALGGEDAESGGVAGA